MPLRPLPNSSVSQAYPGPTLLFVHLSSTHQCAGDSAGQDIYKVVGIL